MTHCNFIFRHREHGSDESKFASHRTYDPSIYLIWIMISPTICANLLLSALGASFLISLYPATANTQNVVLSTQIDDLRLRETLHPLVFA